MEQQNSLPRTRMLMSRRHCDVEYRGKFTNLVRRKQRICDRDAMFDRDPHPPTNHVCLARPAPATGEDLRHKEQQQQQQQHQQQRHRQRQDHPQVFAGEGVVNRDRRPVTIQEYVSSDVGNVPGRRGLKETLGRSHKNKNTESINTKHQHQTPTNTEHHASRILSPVIDRRRVASRRVHPHHGCRPSRWPGASGRGSRHGV